MLKKIFSILIILIGVPILCFFALALFAMFTMDLTYCRETNATYQIEHGYVEKDIGQLFAQMYAKEFDLDSSEIMTYKQLTATSSDFKVGHVYFKTPEGIYYACGWYK